MQQIKERVEKRYMATEKEGKEAENDTEKDKEKRGGEGTPKVTWREERSVRGGGKGEFIGWMYNEVCPKIQVNLNS